MVLKGQGILVKLIEFKHSTSYKLIINNMNTLLQHSYYKILIKLKIFFKQYYIYVIYAPNSWSISKENSRKFTVSEKIRLRDIFSLIRLCWIYFGCW